MADEFKYMILISDLGGYIFSDDRGNSVTQFAADANGKGTYYANYAFPSKYNSVDFSGKTTSDIDNLIRNKVLFTGTAVTDNKLDAIGSSVSEYPFDSSATSWPVLYTTSDYAKPDTPAGFEKSIYLTGNQLLNMKSKSYKIITVTTDYHPGTNFGITSRLYADWIEQNIGLRYDIESIKGNAEEIKKVFSKINAEIFYILGKGTVTDVVAKEFDLVEDSFTLNVNNTVLPLAKADGKYYFGEKSAQTGLYPYVLSYDIATKTVKWDINVAVDRTNPVSLEYVIRADMTKIIPGNQYATNESARLGYMTSTDVDKGVTEYNRTAEFEKPVVSFGYTFNINKIITGKPDTEPDKTFTFILTADNPAYPMPAGSTNGSKSTMITGAGAVDFGAINFESVGVYTYTITEVAGSEVGYTYDTSIYHVRVEVINGELGLITNTIITKGDDTATKYDKIDFNNRFDTSQLVGKLTLSKQVTGELGDKTRYYAFTVTFNNGGTYEYTGSKTGTITSGGTILLKDGETVTINNIPNGVTYTIREEDLSSEGYNTTVQINGGTATKNNIANGAIVYNAEQTVKYVNDKSYTPMTGINMDMLPFIIIIGIAVIGLIILMIAKRRNRNRDIL